MRLGGLLRSIGPALIVAAVVLGPGSILTNSRVGAQFGYEMIWLLVLATLLMAGTVALAGRLGTTLPGSIGDELRARRGRPVAILVGVTGFLIVALFQTSNDVAILAALESFDESWISGIATRAGVLITLNAAVILALVRFHDRYRKIERAMKLLVLVMIVGFASNLPLCSPSLPEALGGLVPRWPEGADVLPTMALVATTFSVAGALYQAYLVREKGWTVADHRKGLRDVMSGIGALGLVSLLIMITAAATLHGRVDPAELRSTTDVARQLEPLFGRAANVLFGLGIFAGAFSSFLVNAIIAGTLLADGLGLGARMDEAWPRRFTVLALLTGMVAALLAELTGVGVVQVIFAAQSLTVVGTPLLALVLCDLAWRRDAQGAFRVPLWMRGVGGLGVAVSVGLSVRTAIRLFGG